VCGLYGSAPADVKSNNESKKIQDFLDSVGVLQQIKSPKHKEFATYEARLKSFDKCLIKLKQDIHTLCDAGFFYIGKMTILYNINTIHLFISHTNVDLFFLGNGTNDQMLCFYCSQGLKDWEENDEPWTEHARWSKNCSYMLLNKGKNFVDKACGMKGNTPKFNPKVIF